MDKNGTTFLSGSHKGNLGTSRLTATVGTNVTYGRIQTPETTYTFKVEAGEMTVVDLGAEGNALVPKAPNDAIIPQPSMEKNASSTESSETNTPPKAYSSPSLERKTTIDLLVVYSEGFAAEHFGDSLMTKLNHLISVANNIYSNSGVDIYLRLVHSVQVNYPDNTANGSALNEITNGIGVFSEIETLRQEHGADLVSLIRSYDYYQQGGCGIAWLLGSPKSNNHFSADHAYSVVSDGSEQVGDWTYFCPETSLAHELGHNMGSAHDRAHLSKDEEGNDIVGAYDYSFGYGQDNNFGTVMSYIYPEIDFFSNPAITCDDGPPAVSCGVSEGQPNSANNVLSLNNAATSIANFVAAKYSADIDGNGQTDLTDTIKALKILTGQTITGTLDSKQDINDDGQLGLPEAIHSLQKNKN